MLEQRLRPLGCPFVLQMITHIGNGWVFHGGWEYPLYLMLISVVVALQAKVRARVNVPGANAINAA